VKFISGKQMFRLFEQRAGTLARINGSPHI
jgi:hypothetical protein